MVASTEKLVEIIENTLTPDALKGANPYNGSEGAKLAEGLRTQASTIKQKAEEEYKANHMGADEKVEDHAQKIAQYKWDAVETYKNSLISSVTGAKDETPVIPTDASDNFLKGIAGATISGAFSGDVSGNIFSAIISGASSLLMSLPFVGDKIRQATIYIQHAFSGKEEDKNFTFAEAGEMVEMQKNAEKYAEILPATPGNIVGLLTNDKALPITNFSQLDKNGNQSLDAGELQALNKNVDAYLTRDEIPDALKAQFDEMLKKRSKEGDQAPTSLDLGSLQAPIALTEFKPAPAAGR